MDKTKEKTTIYYCSDLHLEFDDIDLNLFTKKGDVLLLCGDILNIKALEQEVNSWTKYGEQSHLLDLFDVITNNFNLVIYVVGNHEFYLGSDIDAVGKLRALLSCYSNLKVVGDGELITYKDNAFICGTAWTDFNNMDITTMTQAPMIIADYRQIQHKDSPIKPSFILDKHHDFVNWATHLDKAEYQNVLLVTHHSPTHQTTEDCYKDEWLMNGLFSSNLDELLKQFDYAIHGHMHNGKQVEVNGCRVLSNARGYPHEYSNFKLKYIEV